MREAGVSSLLFPLGVWLFFEGEGGDVLLPEARPTSADHGLPLRTPPPPPTTHHHHPTPHPTPPHPPTHTPPHPTHPPTPHPTPPTPHLPIHTTHTTLYTHQVDVDITSNTVANSVTSLVVGAITSLVVDLAPLVEGQVRPNRRRGAACSATAAAAPAPAPVAAAAAGGYIAAAAAAAGAAGSPVPPLLMLFSAFAAHDYVLCLQGDEELPERLIGSVRFEHLDLKTAAYLDDETGRIFKNERFAS